MNTEGMICSRRKIEAVINNAKCYQAVRDEFGSFCNFLWVFLVASILYSGHDMGAVPVSNGLSQKISKRLKKRGFKFVGEVAMYSRLHACGIINDHDKECDCYKRIAAKYPTVVKRKYLEKH